MQAWPEPVLAWACDGVTLEGPRYRSEVVPTGDPWRWVMRLEVPGIREHDLRQYSCVAKNELNNQTVKGHIKLLCKYKQSFITLEGPQCTYRTKMVPIRDPWRGVAVYAPQSSYVQVRCLFINSLLERYQYTRYPFPQCH